jgi:high-affinity K+ transport system ATPase subunit B
MTGDRTNDAPALAQAAAVAMNTGTQPARKLQHDRPGQQPQ